MGPPGHRTEVAVGDAGDLGPSHWRHLTSVELWKWWTHSRVSRELGVPFMPATDSRGVKRAGRCVWPCRGAAEGGLTPLRVERCL